MSFKKITFAIAAVTANFIDAGRAVIALVRGFLDFMIATIALPVRNAPRPTALLLRGPALAYAGPPIHALRHEAGTPQRGAHRHI